MPTAAATLHRESSPPTPGAVTALPRAAVRARRRLAPMRSIFWRIFLWFWLAALLLAGAVATTIFLTDPGQFFPRSGFLPLQMLDRLAGESVAVYERSGPGALRDFLNSLPRRAETQELPPQARLDHAYLFDAASGRELTGQVPQNDPRELVSRAAASNDVQLERRVGRLLMAHVVGGGAGDGRKYVFFWSMPRSSPLLPTTPQAAFELAAALLVSALVCYWLARYVVSPVRQLQAATRQLAEGNLGARVTASGSLAGRRDEFSVLAGDFNEMAARIEDLLTAQKRLIADISHELGTPLTRLNVALGLAFRKTGDAAPRAELNRIQTEAGRLNELIRQLLLISELEIHEPTEPAERLDLLALVSEVAADAEFEASGRRCRVDVRAVGPVEVCGVRHLLRSAVENVVRNAIRYTAADSEVVIELAVNADHQAVIRVRDHGPGVPEGALASLFQPFYRVSEARDRLSGGTGLGLAITQQAVEAHAGRVRAANQPGGGLLVEIELPLPSTSDGANDAAGRGQKTLQGR